MLTELLLATLMVSITVGVHGAGLHLLTKLLRLEAHEEVKEHINPLSVRGFSATLLAILCLFPLPLRAPRN